MTSIRKVPPRELVQLAAQFLVTRFKLFGPVQIRTRRPFTGSKLRNAHRSCFDRIDVSFCPSGMQKHPLAFTFVHSLPPLKASV